VTGGPLSGLRVIEVSAFVAAPLAGMTLAQLGAEVIRIDPIGGNVDAGRWPVTRDGRSIYWASLNKAKQSVTLDLRTDEGTRLAQDLICAPGENAGIVVSNMPARGWLGYESLRALRQDIIVVTLTGNHDGSPAVDYTVNASSGFPVATGQPDAVTNHVLPAWDVAAGLYLALGVLGAERQRRDTGTGQHVTLALSDVMLATVANLGYVAEVQINGTPRPPTGNDIYGAFGRDFATGDGRRVMVAAMTGRQWTAITAATGLAKRLALIEPMLDVDLRTDGGRYTARRDRRRPRALVCPTKSRADRGPVHRAPSALRRLPRLRSARGRGPAVQHRQSHVQHPRPARNRHRAGAPQSADLHADTGGQPGAHPRPAHRAGADPGSGLLVRAAQRARSARSHRQPPE
jgi:2-methylfumaryl-CoA isomerase